jgi:hypothetical protein
MCFYVENDIYYLRELEDDLCELTRTRWVSRVNSDWFKLMSGKLLGRVFDSAPFQFFFKCLNIDFGLLQNVLSFLEISLVNF